MLLSLMFGILVMVFLIGCCGWKEFSSVWLFLLLVMMFMLLCSGLGMSVSSLGV